MIGALDDMPLPEVGAWLLELGQALETGAAIPGADENAKALRGELFDPPQGRV